MQSQLFEEATDEIARLDQVAVIAPAAGATMLRLAAVARGAFDDQAPNHGPTASNRWALIAAEVDPLHEEGLEESVRTWRDVVTDEVRRARGGGFPSLDRLAHVVPALATYAERHRLEATWREAPLGTAALHRAVDAAAWAPDAALGDLLAGLVLVLGGRTDHLRLRPFRAVPPQERADGIAAWRAGDTDPWTTAALRSASREARRLRHALERLCAGMPAEDAALDALGRGGITARRALAQLRATLATTMPILAEDLGVSRPAATDALARLEAVGLARELTGRGRDRVWAYVPALTLEA